MKWLYRNVPLLGPRKLSPWRNLALAAWNSASAASVHAVVEVEAEPVLRFIAQERQNNGTTLTIIHCVGKAVGEVLRRFPDINCLLRLGRLYRRRDIDIFFTVAMDRRGEDLSGVVVRNVDGMSIGTLAQSMSRSTYELRKYGDASFNKLKGDTLVARGSARILMRAGSFFLYTLNVWSPVLGFPKDAFGSAVVTDISRFGAEYAFPPILPIARVPLVVGVGTVAERCVHDNGRCRSRKLLRLCIVFDHRVIDGVYAGRMCHYLKEIFSRPETYLVGQRAMPPQD